MPKLIVLIEDKYFKIYECEYEFRLNSLQALIGGWPECAYRTKRLDFIGIEKEILNVRDISIDVSSDISIDVWCDEEGHLKGLPFTLSRHSDGHPIVGPVVICFRKEFWTDDGQDFVLMPFDQKTTEEIILHLRAEKWIEVVYNELSAKDAMPTDTEGMPN